MKHKDTTTQRHKEKRKRQIGIVAQFPYLPISLFLCLCVVASLCLIGCNKQPVPSNRVVLYCSVDDVYARPIIRRLEQETGLKIDALYDTEAAKTAGLANKIRAEKARPQGDVFWNSALLQTLLLEREGLVQPYVSPSAKDIPAAFKAKNGSWTGLGVRARVVVSSAPSGAQPDIRALSASRFANQACISNPQFGTGSDWVAALNVRWGKVKTQNYFRALRNNGVRVLPGNSVVAEKVARGELAAGVTDTDDYFAQKPKSTAQYMIALNDPDVVFIPGSVAILKGAPHEANAKKLVDALLKVETEKRLAETMLGVIPTRSGIEVKQTELETLAKQLKKAPNDTEKWAAAWDEIRQPIAEILLAD
jgi:iron(III) transport system substrate-binding protein